MPFFGDTDGSKPAKHATHESAQGTRINSGPFIGTVKNNVDPQRAGRLQVWIGELGGNPDDQSSWRTVSYASPFFGTTPPGYNPNGRDQRPKGQNFATNPHSYGFWMVPPDIGVKVLCMFVNGDPFKGYWFACVPEWPSMHMVPGISGNDKNPLPVVEYNDDDPNDVASLNSFHNRQNQVHQIQAKILEKQGLANDKERGLITSSAFRESPSAVFGFSTPGALLRGEEGEQTGTGRAGGHTFVMDDGDSKGGNQLVRLRTASGHQIMMNDTCGFIHVINSQGTAWFELDAEGNINFYADGNIQMAAKGSINLEGSSVKIKGSSSVDILANGTANITGTAGLNLSSTNATKIGGKKSVEIMGLEIKIDAMKDVKIGAKNHVDVCAACVDIKRACKKEMKGSVPSAQGPSLMPTREPWGGHKGCGKGKSNADAFRQGFAAGAISAINSSAVSAAQNAGAAVGNAVSTAFSSGGGSSGGSGSGSAGGSPAGDGGGILGGAMARDTTTGSPAGDGGGILGGAITRSESTVSGIEYYANYAGNAVGDALSILQAIKRVESGGNYRAKSKTSSASGAYQFTDSTWQALTKATGIGTQYSSAASAPSEIQDAIATTAVNALYSKFNGDLAKIANEWFAGNPNGDISSSRQDANPGVTPEEYQKKLAQAVAQEKSNSAKNKQGTNLQDLPDRQSATGDGSIDSKSSPSVPLPSSRSGAIKDVNNPYANTQGYVPPDKERQWRVDYRNSNLMKGLNDFLTLQPRSVSQPSTTVRSQDNLATIREVAAIRKEEISATIEQNEASFQQGSIGESEYLATKAVFEAAYQNLTEIEKDATARINRMVLGDRMEPFMQDDYVDRPNLTSLLLQKNNGTSWSYDRDPNSVTVAESISIDTSTARDDNSIRQPISALAIDSGTLPPDTKSDKILVDFPSDSPTTAYTQPDSTKVISTDSMESMMTLEVDDPPIGGGKKAPGEGGLG